MDAPRCCPLSRRYECGPKARVGVLRTHGDVAILVRKRPYRGRRLHPSRGIDGDAHESCLGPTPVAAFVIARIEARPQGHGVYIVQQSGAGAYGNRATITFGDSPRESTMACTCSFPARYRIPCCHVVAALIGQSGGVVSVEARGNIARVGTRCDCVELPS